jgi:hypothetical protein
LSVTIIIVLLVLGPVLKNFLGAYPRMKHLSGALLG